MEVPVVIFNALIGMYHVLLNDINYYSFNYTHPTFDKFCDAINLLEDMIDDKLPHLCPNCKLSHYHKTSTGYLCAFCDYEQDN